MNLDVKDSDMAYVVYLFVNDWFRTSAKQRNWLDKQPIKHLDESSGSNRAHMPEYG
jgi:hypothetical protein